MSADRHDGQVVLAAMALAAIGLACFWPALGGPFLFDDFPHLARLALVDGHLSFETLKHYLASVGILTRPLAALTFLVEDQAWPAMPFDFKRDNLLLHLLAGVLVFAFVRTIAAATASRDRHTDWLALACTAMWLLHPMQLSATMLVVQRMNILSTIFTLAGLIGYVGVVRADRGTPFARVALAGLVLAASGAVAFLCKENGVLVFAYAAVLNATLLRDRIDAYSRPARTLLRVGTIAPLVVLLLAAAANPDFVLAGYERRDFTLSDRLLTQPRALVEYAYSILVPRIGGQGIFHDGYVASTSLLAPATTLPAIALLLAAAASAWFLRRRFPVYAFAVLWFLAGHLMESSFIPLELYFEHRNYLPMVGPLFGLAWLVFHLHRARGIALALLVAWIAASALLTHANARIWGDPGKLALVWLEENPRSSRAAQLAVKYFHDRGDYQAARQTLDRALARMPDDPDLNAQTFLLDCLHVGLTERQWHAFEAYTREVEVIGVLPEVVTAFRQQLAGPACRSTLEVDQLRGLVSALVANPAVRDEPEMMGYFHYELAKLAERERDLDGTMRHMDLAFRHRPNPMIPREQAFLLLTAGLPGEALEYLDRSEGAVHGTRAWLLDMPRRNAGLRQNAIRMLRKMDAVDEAP